MTTPYEQADDLDYIVLGYTPSPGRVVLSGHDRWKNWDIQKAKGTVGATSKLNGDDVGSFTATFYLAHDDLGDNETNDFDRWEEFQRLIESMTAGPTPTALPIYHPDLARNKFAEVSSGGIGGLVHDGKGGATVVVKFVEYKPPKPKAAAGAKAKPGASAPGGAPKKADPNAAAKAELAALVAEAKKP
jgi:hypothetical protein